MFVFRNNNPDKGTETHFLHPYQLCELSFRNNNPDKGTETQAYQDHTLVWQQRLEIITPTRGQ